MAPRYCADCGGPLARRAVGHEGIVRPLCNRCGRVFYPAAKPTAGALVLRDGRVLLAQRGVEPERGKWDIPGGFLEPDELPQAGALRELAEETGLAIRVTGFLGFYLDTYAYGPPGGDETVLNIYFLATADGEPCAADDVADLGWFSPDALPPPGDLAFPHTAAALDDLRHWFAAQD